MVDHSPRNNLRPLAPKGPDADGRQPSRCPEDGRTKRASTACGECKLRRTKCTVDDSGGPCTECALHNRECIIDELADRRRKIAAKETEENLRRTQRELQETQRQLQYYRTYVNSILSSIRGCQEAELTNIVKVIRHGTDDEIQAYLSQFVHYYPHNSPTGRRGTGHMMR
ncbi:hypothetical protein BDW74DRAFT_5220 [Aspergillus multicolor]|uniref:Zn(II)2Cys6 transcription factor domain-containing protein n=1 Tax=Aspergillus multicolor TaxID=41759 RepID=UPI003CCE3EE9